MDLNWAREDSYTSRHDATDFRHSSGFSYASGHNTFGPGMTRTPYSSLTTTGTAGRTQSQRSSIQDTVLVPPPSPLLTPPNSTRTSFENSAVNIPTPPKNTDSEGTLSSLICPPLSPPTSAPSSPIHKPVLLDDIISQVKDVLAGRTDVLRISNVMPELYEELEARAKVDDDLAGWDGIRYVVLTRDAFSQVSVISQGRSSQGPSHRWL
jgi:hypothetical protein